jgi:IS30 family transposase
VNIVKRTAIVYRRTCYGDWEADLIKGGAGSGFLLSVYERKSRIRRLYLLPDKSSAETIKAFVTVLHRLNVSSDIYDNGVGFARHGVVKELLEVYSYFFSLILHEIKTG